MQRHERIVVLLTVLYFALYSIATAQDTIPVVTPSYIEDFSDIKSYPSMCIGDAFVDRFGRMWLMPCGASLRYNVRLLQFDGYRFQHVEGTHDKIPHPSSTHGLFQGQFLVGMFGNPDSSRMYLFDLQNMDIRVIDLPSTGNIVSVQTSEHEILLALYLEGEIRLFRFDGEEFTLLQERRLISQQQTESDVTRIRPLYCNSDVAWFLSSAENDVESYFLRLDLRSSRVDTIDAPSVRGANLRPTFIPLIRELNGRTFLGIVIEAQSYLFEFDPQGGRFIQLELPSMSRNSVFADEFGNLLYIFEAEGDRIRAVLEESNGNRLDYTAFFADRVNFHVHNIIGRDFRKEFWILHSTGLILMRVSQYGAIQSYGQGRGIRVMHEMSDGNVFVLSQSSSLWGLLDLRNKKFSFSLRDPNTCGLNQRKLIDAGDDKVWGLNRADLSLHDLRSGTCEIHATGFRQCPGFTSVGPESMAMIDEDGHVWIYNYQEDTKHRIEDDSGPVVITDFVHDIDWDGKDIWIATADGLYQLNATDGSYRVLGNEEPFSDNRFLCIDIADDGKIWLGTPLNGVNIYDPVNHTLKVVNSDVGLGNNTVVCIQEDDDGDRWIGTYNGVSLASPEGEVIINLYVEDGLAHQESNRYAAYKTSDGKIIIGTISGLSVIDPAAIKEDLRVPVDLKIYLTRLKYTDHKTGHSVTRTSRFGPAEHVVLPADSRNLTISFATSSYFKVMENRFAYRIEGLHRDWINIGTQSDLFLDDLPAGTHKVQIRGSDNVGNWTDEPIEIMVTAREFFYRQSWFYLLCALVIGGSVLFWIHRLRLEVKSATRKIEEDKQTIEKQAARLQELDEAKSHFFTNISHEFRTPLTIISGMAGQILENPKVWTKRGAHMILRNSNNLLQLVNQIMDLRKLESRKLEVNYVQGDIIEYLRYLAESFQSFAANKNVQLHFLTNANSLIMDYDPDKIMKIISNLLSNAIKFTPEQGNVYLQLEDHISGQDPMLHVRVRDTGIGIPEEKLAFVFDRYYQVDELIEQQASSKMAKAGTGVGLSLTQELVELLGGSIEVTSEVGSGTSFLVKLPVHNTSPVSAISMVQDSPAAILTEIPVVLSDPDQTPLPATDEPFGASGNDLPQLLIVEDNPDMQQYIGACVDSDYACSLADNGKSGVEMALDMIPDLIVSDVMMPDMDGYELCRTLKSDERTNHIPIILLTAKADFDSKITGLETGADAYLTKPFEPKELMLTLRNFMELQRHIQEQFVDGEKTSKRAVDLRDRITDPLLVRIYDLIMENLSDAELDMTRLSRSLAMSRSQIFRKVKALTGKPPTVFIRSLRLHKAKELLAETDLTVSEIAYETGFTSLNYFSAAFLDEFGVRPSATRN